MLLQKKCLFVYDPKALSYIVVKEQYIYDAAPWITSIVGMTLGPGLLATRGTSCVIPNTLNTQSSDAAT